MWLQLKGAGHDHIEEGHMFSALIFRYICSCYIGNGSCHDTACHQVSFLLVSTKHHQAFSSPVLFEVMHLDGLQLLTSI